jgi:hypothetical protein
LRSVLPLKLESGLNLGKLVGGGKLAFQLTLFGHILDPKGVLQSRNVWSLLNVGFQRGSVEKGIGLRRL